MRKSRFKRAYRVKRKKPVFKNRFFRIIILILILVAELSYLLLFSSVFRIKNIQISGNDKIAPDAILGGIRNMMGGRFGNNVLLLNSADIESAFLKTFPQAATIELKKALPDTLKVKIEERRPAAIFCPPAIGAGQNDSCFTADKTGVIFASLPPKQEIGEISTESLPIIRNQTFSGELNLGAAAIQESKMAQVLDIKKRLDEIKIEAKEFSIISEQRLNAKTAEGWQIYFNLKKDISWQITELIAVLNAKIPPAKRKNLEYIDLRFDKVFVYPGSLL